MMPQQIAHEQAHPMEEETNGGDDHEENKQSRGDEWWNKVLDMEEAKTQIFFSLPMVLTNASYYLITLVSVMFSGHLGRLPLAGATLSNSWASVTGFAFMVGLSGALETLCGQAFGAKDYKMLGIHLQCSGAITFFFSIFIAFIWLYTEPILELFHQAHDISEEAALYLKFLIPGLFAYGLVQNIMRFLQTQSIVRPLILLSALPLVLHVGLAYALVNRTSLAIKGASFATSISLCVSLLLMAIYVICSKKIKQTWEGFSAEAFHYIIFDLKLALPSAAMVCLEYWAFEVLVFLAGLMPDSKITTSVIAMCVSTQAIAYMIVYGLSAAASTRVSNELGAGNPDKAKNAMVVTLKLSLFLSLFVVLALGLGRRTWAKLFSDSPRIIEGFASMTPLVAFSMIVDSLQGVLLGVARGCGWQNLAVVANLATYYLIGIPVACLLGFKFKLYAKGLWIGLICGLTCQTCALLIITKRAKWTKLNLSDSSTEKKEKPEVVV